MREKVEADYNASQVNAVTQGLDGNPVTLIQVTPVRCIPGPPLPAFKLFEGTAACLFTDAAAAPLLDICSLSLSWPCSGPNVVQQLWPGNSRARMVLLGIALHTVQCNTHNLPPFALHAIILLDLIMSGFCSTHTLWLAGSARHRQDQDHPGPSEHHHACCAPRLCPPHQRHLCAQSYAACRLQQPEAPLAAVRSLAHWPQPKVRHCEQIATPALLLLLDAVALHYTWCMLQTNCGLSTTCLAESAL